MKYHYRDKMWRELTYQEIKEVLTWIDNPETAQVMLNLLRCSTLSEFRKAQDSIAQDVLTINKDLNKED